MTVHVTSLIGINRNMITMHYFGCVGSHIRFQIGVRYSFMWVLRARHANILMCHEIMESKSSHNVPSNSFAITSGCLQLLLSDAFQRGDMNFSLIFNGVYLTGIPPSSKHHIWTSINGKSSKFPNVFMPVC